MTEVSKEAREEEFAPCPLCKQYSHSIGEDALAKAYMHFQSMYAHPVRGHPMGHNFDEQTRDAAQLLMSAARHREQALASSSAVRDALEDCHAIESGPNGLGGMRVAAHFRDAPNEQPLFRLLNAALTYGRTE